MGTSIIDLLDAAEAEAVTAASPKPIPQIVATLNAVAALLTLLADDGVDRAPGGARERAIRNLARHCATASSLWPQQASRTTELLAATRDAIAVNRERLGCADRWALSLRVSTLARHAADTVNANGPYDHLPVLRLIRASAAEIRRHGARHPAHLMSGSVLREPIPAPLWTIATPTVAQLLEHVTHEIRHSRDPITITDIQAACRVAETAAGLLARDLAGPAGQPADAATQAWQEARRTLAPFTDAAGSVVVSSAMQACRQLEGARAAGPVDTAELMEIRQDLCRLGDAIVHELRRPRPAPLIRPGLKPLRAERSTEWRDRRTVVADGADLDVVEALVTRARDAAVALMHQPDGSIDASQLAREPTLALRTHSIEPT